MITDAHDAPEREVKLLLDRLLDANTEAARAMLATSQQAIAGMLTNALIVREMARAGLIDVEALRGEAVDRAMPFGPTTVAVIQNIFGSEPPRGPEPAAPPPFTVILGGLTKA